MACYTVGSSFAWYAQPHTAAQAVIDCWKNMAGKFLTAHILAPISHHVINHLKI